MLHHRNTYQYSTELERLYNYYNLLLSPHRNTHQYNTQMTHRFTDLRTHPPGTRAKWMLLRGSTLETFLLKYPLSNYKFTAVVQSVVGYGNDATMLILMPWQ